MDEVETITTDTEEESLSPAQLAMDKFQSDRYRLLGWTDWTVLPDSPLGADEQEAWKKYRQSLRDMTAAVGFDPADPQWPIMPGKEGSEDA